jgi:cytochrome c biogenesis protein CcdA/thiol-disulfide isomerase/thioredoxin
MVAFIGGALTIMSPCILPVLPFVFARTGQPFRRSGLPLLAGMAVTFAAAGALAGIAGEWIVRANQYGRAIAMVVVASLGVTLLVPALADLLTRPLVRLGGAVRPRNGYASIGGSLLLGVSTGLLWTPCAGPVLGLILAAVALEGAGARSAVLLLLFATGAASALALALAAGNRVFDLMKRSLGADEWIRRGLGAAILIGVLGVALGWDTGVLSRVSLTGFGTATRLEQQLVDRARPADDAPKMAMAAPMMMTAAQPGQAGKAAPSRVMPPLDGAVEWLNGTPKTGDSLRGMVVLIDFWTYSCINCLRAIPYVKAWSKKYADQGLVVVGVHSPEFAFERDPKNVARATRDLGIGYPVAVDSNRAIWKAFDNEYWPAHYVVDANGAIRYHHFGEGRYDETEKVIQTLLAELTNRPAAGDVVEVAASGVEAAPDLDEMQSPETYVGYERQENYASREKIAHDTAGRYTAPGSLRPNQWGLSGSWTVGAESAVLQSMGGKIVFRFHARDLHLVLGPRADGKPVRFRVTVDGAPPLENRGGDVDAQGIGSVGEYRLYQLIRQKGAIQDRTFQIEFLDAGVQAFAFTFG